MIVIFNLLIFVISLRENKKALINSNENILKSGKYYTKKLYIESLMESKWNQNVNIYFFY